MGVLQEQILNLLSANLCLSINKIARLLNKHYSQVYYAILSLKDKGIVDTVTVEEYLPHSDFKLKVRYVYLIEREKEVLAWLESSSHTLRLKKQRF